MDVDRLIAIGTKGVEQAVQRIHAAPDVEQVEVEVVNALGHLYRLRERLGELVGSEDALHSLLALEPNQLVSALIWARNGEVHDYITYTALEDRFPDRFIEMYGTPVWQEAPMRGKRDVPHSHYSNRLVGETVGQTITEGLALLAGLLRTRLRRLRHQDHRKTSTPPRSMSATS